MSRPTLQQLQYLVAIADHHHFGRAAAACYVTQPALSSQLRELERRIGVPLVERGPRGALLTAAGEVAVTRARQVLREVDDLVEAAQRDVDGITGPLHLGVIPTIAPYLLPRLVPTLVSRYPEAELHLREQRTAELVTGLRAGTLDLALLALPAGDDSLAEAALGSDPFLLALPEQHPLARRRAGVTEADLRSLRMLLLDDGHCLRGQALAVCHRAGAAPSAVQATSLPTLVQMVAAGMGATLLPASAAAVEARPGNGVVTRRFRGDPPARTIGLAWRRTSGRGHHFEELARLLRPLVAERRAANAGE